MLAESNFGFNIIDYSVFSILLCISAAIGIYFGYFSKSDNTTDEYLLGGKRMKTVPIAISLIASQLSGISLMAFPTEMYSFGIIYSVIVPSMFIAIPIMVFIIVPVFYVNDLSNCNKYLEMRFDQKTRQIVTAIFIISLYFFIPIIIFIPALAFSQVTSINVHLINAVVCAVCVFYTMLGGIKAVVWTDVVQASVMLGSVFLVASVGIYKVGGFNVIFQRAIDGGRLNIFQMKLDLTTRASFWNCLFGGITLWTSYVGLNQSCVQRIVALPSLAHAKKSLIVFGFGFFIIMTINCFTGIIMYARYYNCDPVTAGIVDKPDKLMPFFVQDIVGHLKGMPGVFISCIFSAALSTMSANLNSLSGIIYFDYIRPFVKHTEKKANFIMKFIVLLTGIYCVACGLMVEQFGSILQMVVTICGISQGVVFGVFMLGMLVPRANSKGAFCGTIISLSIMIWISVGAQIKMRSGEIKYASLPLNISGCDSNEFNANMTANLHTISLNNNNIEEDDSFSLYKISFNWYSIMGAVICWIIAIPISYLLPDEHKINAKLIAPCMQSFIPKEILLPEEVPLNEPEKTKKPVVF